MSENPKNERAKIFLGGEIGYKLKKIDEKRHLSLFMQNPDILLLSYEIEEINNFSKKLRKLSREERKQFIIELKETKRDISFKGNLFREHNRLLYDYQETTTRNAAMVAEKPEGLSIADIIKKEMEHSNDEE